MKFTIQKFVSFHHCDPTGIVFYPQFFYLLHEVQQDFLAHIELPERELIKSGIGVPIVDMKAEFLGVCHNGDQLLLSLTLSTIGNASLGMQYDVSAAGNAYGRTQRCARHRCATVHWGEIDWNAQQ